MPCTCAIQKTFRQRDLQTDLAGMLDEQQETSRLEQINKVNQTMTGGLDHVRRLDHERPLDHDE